MFSNDKVVAWISPVSSGRLRVNWFSIVSMSRTGIAVVGGWGTNSGNTSAARYKFLCSEPIESPQFWPCKALFFHYISEVVFCSHSSATFLLFIFCNWLEQKEKWA